jgi:putative endonuclease
MYIVYILRNKLNNRYYIGSTNNLSRRLEEHNRGQSQSTRNGIWEVIYTEELITYSEAVRREKQIKSYKSGNAFKRLVQR